MHPQAEATISRDAPSEPSADVMRSSPLLASLKALVPDEVRTLLLRAALLEGAAGERAWKSLTERSVDLAQVFRDDVVGVKRLGPLLYASSRDGGVERPPAYDAVLRTAYVREQMRASEYAKILGSLLRALNGAGREYVLLTGAALGYTVYPEPTLRHAHDIDLLIRPGAQDDILRAAEPAGFGSPRPAVLSVGTLVGLVHDSLLPALLHEHFFRVPGFGPDPAAIWSQADTVEILGVPARVLAPHHSLLRIFTRASLCPRRAGAQWVTDAWHVARAGDMDWEAFTDAATSGQLAGPALVFLDYLARELEMDVPPGVVARLGAAAPSTSAFARDLLLFGARHHIPGTGALHELDITPSAARSLKRTVLFPSADYLRFAAGEGRGPIPLLWLRRVLRSLRG